ncbi:right-handed parallel beta-helix repeat-containing protein [Emticicia sp. TH156]|uniref:right-handed parallel beta-helix repeat-containing protein n=1 Tax=Emticicia sp. TH156 TaxID=2067454 RepID=UPI000C761BD5|nr:right-handed parallel beta-helix repeat-containing protein [Emticicia sp. TH156]PLK42243.1 hypothetical protein C0V77_21760 [Emticicia sp. TH156]
MKTIYTLSILFIAFCGFVFSIDIFQVKAVPENLSRRYFNPDAKFNFPANTFRITNQEVRNQPSVTAYIQDMLNKHNSVLLPDTVLRIEKPGLLIPSGRNLYFSKNTLIEFVSQATSRLDDILKIYDVSNVRIYNAKIKGSKNLEGQKGEWSAGIAILNGTNIYIENAHIYDTWGDGLFIGSESNGVSKNVTVRNVWIDNARRNAISVTSAINASIHNVLLCNTNGTLPECGVDVEPSLSGEYLQNVKFRNLYSYNNKNAAFNINLGSFSSDTYQYPHPVDIELNNFVDEHSTRFVGININNAHNKFTPAGKIRIFNGTSFSSNHNIEFWKKEPEANIDLIYGNIKKKSN